MTKSTYTKSYVEVLSNETNFDLIFLDFTMKPLHYHPILIFMIAETTHSCNYDYFHKYPGVAKYLYAELREL